MMNLTLRNFTLALYIASTLDAVSFSYTVPLLDPCSILGAVNRSRITYKHVADCYRNIPFNNATAKATLDTLHTLYADFFVFRDVAMTSALPKPFTSSPVDIVKALEDIRNATYSSDFEFHMAVENAVKLLNDPHSAYSPECYEAYAFTQPLDFYAPVISSLQSLRVLRDKKHRGYEDCIVDTIDGLPGLEYMRAWADRHTPFSKDSGVRLNFALGSQAFNTATRTFEASKGMFSERSSLPERGFVEYGLKCAQFEQVGKGKETNARAIFLRDEWRVLPLNSVRFRDTVSYRANMCLQLPSVHHRRSIKAQSVPALGHKGLFPKRPTAPPQGSPAKDAIIDATLVASGIATGFYHLPSHPWVGVIVVSTHEAPMAEMSVIQIGLDHFHALNVTHIILDLQGNFGGHVDFASQLVEIFFPRHKLESHLLKIMADPLDKSLLSDMRVSSMVQKASGFMSAIGIPDIFNPRYFYNVLTKAPYSSNLFLEPVVLTRNNRHALYTPLITLHPANLSIAIKSQSYPWTGDSTKIRILSDGRCGSACALSCHLLRAKYNVTGIAVGGHQNEDLSMFSFAGGVLSTVGRLTNAFESVNMVSPLEPLPYRGRVTIPILEVYPYLTDGVPSGKSDFRSRVLPLEYDAASAKAELHLDLSPKTARRRDLLWSHVANISWT